ncbi:ubiquitinyl hydrolase 1 [Neonectria punicea]|uniref:Ubiquitin carboxyl-terminal hydrolase n=1 Tax=Neonectria punicea TaxID=979145 RepID=A0ABR1GKC4_9HYPO
MAGSACFIPLESNPEVFNKIIHDIGVMPYVEFRDVYSISEPSILATLPRPVLALILVGPTDMVGRGEEPEPGQHASTPEYAKAGDQEDIFWFKQTIRNACGLYAILHSVANGVDADFVYKESVLDKLLTTCRPLLPNERARAVETCEGLERAYTSTARSHEQSSVPRNLGDLGNHYLCLTKSRKTGHLYQVSASRKDGPVDMGPVHEHEDVLGPHGTAIVQNYLDAAKGDPNAVFSLIALVPTS